MNIAIVLAGGVGSRLGAGIPKQFVEVLGKPILAYTLENLENNKNIDLIEIVCHKEWTDYVYQIVKNYNITKFRWLALGGDTFQKSTINGIFNLQGKIDSNDIVVLHFGVSPMTTVDVVEDSIKIAKLYGNGIASEDCVLCKCIKDDDDSSTQNLIRETVKGFSNPWAFKYGELCEVYNKAIKLGILDEIEPHTTSVYFHLGYRIWFSKSNGHNFKITTPEDVERFEAMLLLKEKRLLEGKEVYW